MPQEACKVPGASSLDSTIRIEGLGIFCTMVVLGCGSHLTMVRASTVVNCNNHGIHSEQIVNVSVDKKQLQTR